VIKNNKEFNSNYETEKDGDAKQRNQIATRRRNTYAAKTSLKSGVSRGKNNGIRPRTE